MRWIGVAALACLVTVPSVRGDDRDVRQVLEIAEPMIDQVQALRDKGDPTWESSLANVLAMLRLAAQPGAPAEAFLALARAEMLGNNDDAAATAFQAYLASTPDPTAPVAAEARLFLAEYHIRRGIEAIVAQDLTLAAQHLGRALDYDPSNEMAKTKLAQIRGGADEQGSYWLPTAGTMREPVRVSLVDAPARCLERAREELLRGDWQAAAVYLAALNDVGKRNPVAASLALAAAGRATTPAPHARAALEDARDTGLLAGFVGLRSAVAASGAALWRAALLTSDDLRAYGTLNRVGGAKTEVVSEYASQRVIVLVGRVGADAETVASAPCASLQLESSDGVRVGPLPNRPWPVLDEFLGPDAVGEGAVVVFPNADAGGRPVVTETTQWVALSATPADSPNSALRFVWPLAGLAPAAITIVETTGTSGTSPGNGVEPAPTESGPIVVTPGPGEGGEAAVATGQPGPSESGPGQVAPTKPAPSPTAVADAGSENPADAAEGEDAGGPMPSYVHETSGAAPGPVTPVIEPSPSRPMQSLSGTPLEVDPSRATPVILVGSLDTEEAVYGAFLPLVGRVVTIGEQRALALWFAEPYTEALLKVTADTVERARLLAIQEASKMELVLLVSVPEPEGEGALSLAARCVLTDAHANRRRGRSLENVLGRDLPPHAGPGGYICFAKTSNIGREIMTREANELSLSVEIGRATAAPRFTWKLPLPLPEQPRQP